MMLRLFFTVHNESYLWWILRVFCFLWLELFSRCSFLLNQAKKYCFHGIWKWVIFKAQTLYPNGEEDIQRIVNQNVFNHLVLPTQSAKSQTTQAPSDITEKSAMACCTRTSRVQQRNRLGWECLSRSRLSGFLAEFCLATYLLDESNVWHFISWPSKILSQRTASTQHHLQHLDSSPQLCDVNANDISGTANM